MRGKEKTPPGRKHIFSRSISKPQTSSLHLHNPLSPSPTDSAGAHEHHRWPPPPTKSVNADHRRSLSLSTVSLSL